MTIIRLLVLSAAVALLSQCAHRSNQEPRYLSNHDEGKIISERYYEMDGVRKVERRILVTATPRYETRLETEILGTSW